MATMTEKELKKIAKKIKNLKKDKKKKKKIKTKPKPKPLQKQKQKQSVSQKVIVQSQQPQTQQRPMFPTQIIQTPQSSDTEFLRSVIQQQIFNNLTRDYKAKNPPNYYDRYDRQGINLQQDFGREDLPIGIDIDERMSSNSSKVTQKDNDEKLQFGDEASSFSLDTMSDLGMEGAEEEEKTISRQVKRREPYLTQNRLRLFGDEELEKLLNTGNKDYKAKNPPNYYDRYDRQGINLQQDFGREDLPIGIDIDERMSSNSSKVTQKDNDEKLQFGDEASSFSLDTMSDLGMEGAEEEEKTISRQVKRREPYLTQNRLRLFGDEELEKLLNTGNKDQKDKAEKELRRRLNSRGFT